MHNAQGSFPQNGGAAQEAARTQGSDGVPAALMEAIAATAGMLRLAEGIAAAGRPVDLAGLDDVLGRVCAQALDLPPALGAGLRPALAGLASDLDRLSLALRRP